MEGERILVADDEPTIRKSLQRTLTRGGYDAVVVEDGQQAFDALREAQGGSSPFDAVITDIQMPHMTGTELIDKIIEMQYDIPVLVVTSVGDKEIVIDLLRKGCSDYIDKPVFPEDLLNRLNLALGKHRDSKRQRERQTHQVEQEKAALEQKLKGYQESFQQLSGQLASAVVAYQQIMDVDISEAPVQIAYKNRPLTELGGDYFDTCNTETGCDIVLADVAGHDIGASYHTVLLKAFFEENARVGYDGSTFFRLLNKELLENGRTQRMVTAIFLRIDLVNMQGELVTACHPHAVRMKRSLPVPTPVHTAGSPLGIFDDVEFENAHFQIRAGDRFFLYTDGINNAIHIDGPTGRREPLAPDLFDDMISRHRGKSLEAQVEDVWNDVLDYCNHKPDDDMLLVGVEIPGE